MKIQYFSDLHLEFQDNLNWIDNNTIERVGDVLIIAGDLCPFVKLSNIMYKSEIAEPMQGLQKKYFGFLVTTSTISLPTPTPLLATNNL